MNALHKYQTCKCNTSFTSFHYFSFHTYSCPQYLDNKQTSMNYSSLMAVVGSPLLNTKREIGHPKI